MSEAEDIARSREFLQTGVGTTTRRNKVLPAPRLPTPIPPRIGSAGPREVDGQYVEVDYAFRVLETDNSMTYNYDMMNTPLVGNMRLYLRPRPRDTTAGDANYYASAVKLTTTDGLLKTDYQLTLKTAMVRPASGADRVCGFGVNPVTKWFPDIDLIRGPTGVHALVKKPRKIDMLVDGTPETLTLKPPPYTKPAGNGLCVLDEIQKIGDPWHGLIQGGTLRLPGGKTRPVARPGIGTGVVYPLIPYGVVPAATADAADVASGRTWLNYGLVAGFCLYEQSITTGAPSWVYIAPDNTTWRVLCLASTLLGVQTLTLSFYPLRKMFLTADKWGGLAQTLQVQINPTTSNYGYGTLYDLDSKGANAVFFNPTGFAIGGALLNIQGIPPAATGTYTLLCDGSPLGSAYSMSGSVPIPQTRIKTWLYHTLRFNEVTGESIFGPVTEYVQDQMVPDPEPADFLPPLPQPDFPWSLGWRIGWKQTKKTNTSLTTVITGYAFDSADALQEVLHAAFLIYAHTEKPVAGSEYATVPSTEIFGDGGSYTQYTKIGGVNSDPVEWTFDGVAFATASPNAYGPFIVGGSNVTVSTIRYSNRVYGLRVAVPGESHYHHRPPMSPDAKSIYVADIVSQYKPFATYHPVTQQLVWETGFVNFV